MNKEILKLNDIVKNFKSINDDTLLNMHLDKKVSELLEDKGFPHNINEVIFTYDKSPTAAIELDFTHNETNINTISRIYVFQCMSSKYPNLEFAIHTPHVLRLDDALGSDAYGWVVYDDLGELAEEIVRHIFFIG